MPNTELSKGDYVGHPFRGNQWSDDKVVADYQLNGVQVNADLRSGKRSDGPLDTLMHTGPTETLYRTVSNANGAADKLGNELANGASITDLAYVSTSRDELTASDMDPVGDGIMLRISLPEGAPRLDIGNYKTAYDQSEVVLPRQTVLTPTGKMYDSDGRKTIDVVASSKMSKASSQRVRFLKFSPSVVIKGDYVGHPFRGNQWSDASGAGRGTSGSASQPADDLNAILGRYPETTDEMEIGLMNAPILNSPLGQTMSEINKQIYAAERGDAEESDMLDMVIFSAYLGKSQYFYDQLNGRLRKDKPFSDELMGTISDKDQERIDEIESEIVELEDEQSEDDEIDNSAEITELEEEKTAIEDAVDENGELDAWDWNYYDHASMDFDSQDGSVELDMSNGDTVRMPLVVAATFMDEAFTALKFRAPTNMRVYRGIDPAYIAMLESSVGKTVNDLGFCSTSLDVVSAVAFSGSGTPMQSQLQGVGMPEKGSVFPPNQRIATILIPEGHNVVMPDPAGDRMGEGEVLLNRGTQFKVVGVNEMGPVLEVVPDVSK
jgi:hypothetical protein